jgi:transcriptional regulator with XRE-family HTH domain
MNFGGYLSRARGDQSYRDLDKATGIDHAYIWRLERGDNSNPSPEIVEKLSKALILSPRKGKIFALLATVEIPDELCELMEEHTEIDWDTFQAVATMSNRGKRPTTKDDWLRFVKVIEELDLGN